MWVDFAFLIKRFKLHKNESDNDIESLISLIDIFNDMKVKSWNPEKKSCENINKKNQL